MERLVGGRWPRILVAACLLVAVVWWGGRAGDATFSGSQADGSLAPPLNLRDDHGSRFDIAADRGRVTLVYFGYTSCPDVCPTTLGELSAIWPYLGADRDRTVEVFVTLDPQRDTPALLRDYLSNFDPPPLGLTGTPAEIAAAARQWGIVWRWAEGGRFIDHTSVVMVVGPDGRQRLRYGFSQLGDPQGIARDIQRVLHES